MSHLFQKYVDFLAEKHQNSSRRLASFQLRKAIDFNPASNDCNWSKTLKDVPATPGSGFSCLADQLEFYTFQQRNILSDTIVKMLARKLLGRGVIKRMLGGGAEGRRAGKQAVKYLLTQRSFLKSLRQALNQVVLKDKAQDNYLNALSFIVRSNKPYVFEWVKTLPQQYYVPKNRKATLKKLVNASLFSGNEDMVQVLENILLDQKIAKTLALSIKYLYPVAVDKDKMPSSSQSQEENRNDIEEIVEFVQTVFSKNWHNSYLKQEILYRLYSSGIPKRELKREIVRDIKQYLSDNQNSSDRVFKGVKSKLENPKLLKGIAKYVSENRLDSLDMRDVINLGGGFDFELGEEPSGYSEGNF